MKKLIFVFGFMFAMISCNNGKTDVLSSSPVDTTDVDTTIVDSTLIDTISID